MPAPLCPLLKRREPQTAQNCRVTGIPEPPGAVYRLGLPVTLSALSGNAARVECPVPLAIWQSRHEQRPANKGSPEASKRIAPHWQPPVNFVMTVSRAERRNLDRRRDFLKPAARLCAKRLNDAVYGIIAVGVGERLQDEVAKFEGDCEFNTTSSGDGGEAPRV